MVVWYLREEGLPDLAYPMVMTEAATRGENLLPGKVLQLTVERHRVLHTQ